MYAPAARVGLSAGDVDDSTLIVTLDGEIDLLSCADIESAILAALDLWPRVVVDLARVTFCASYGLGMFVRCEDVARRRGAELVLANPSPRVLRVVEITGLGHLLAS
jgi:anti-anti-sigma factor